MTSDPSFQQLSYRHIAVIALAAMLTLWGLAAIAGISFWLAVGASAVFGLFTGLYAMSVLPLLRQAKRPALVDDSLREQARLADGFDEALVIINKRERVLYANPAAESLFGARNENTYVSHLIDDPSILALVKDTLAGTHSKPVTFHRSSPVEQHIRVMASGIYADYDTGQVQRAIIVFYDITDLVRADTMRADFLANASHELKTPVASLLGYIETLQGHAKDDPEAQEAFLKIMQQQAQRMQRLINDLLSLRRIEIAEHRVPTEVADLYLAVRAALESVKPLAKKTGVKISYSGPKEALVIGIQDELVQLVLNILDNAMSVTPENGRIDLALEIKDKLSGLDLMSLDSELSGAPRREIVSPPATNDGFVLLRIRDRGPGFAAEHLPRVGERFYKILGQSKPQNSGTGLGLAIVKHIMRRHRGGLMIESQQDVGTLFTILLPLPPIE